MRLLIVSAGYWSNWGCFGATYSSIFGGLTDVEIGQVYFNLTLPAADVPPNVTRFFKVGLKAAALSPLTRKFVGSEVSRRTADRDDMGEYTDCSSAEKSLIYYFRRHHWTWLKWLGYWFIARFGRWRSPQLREFIKDFRPDAIWVDATPTMPSLAMGIYLKKLTGLPMTGYIYDEHYSLKRLRFSPAFWLYRLASRRLIRRVILESQWFYTISEAQREYYERKFGKTCYVLTRSADFSGEHPLPASRRPEEPLKLVYTGNLSNGRYKALMIVGEAIRRAGLHAELDVYSSQPVSRRLVQNLESGGMVRFRGTVSGAEILAIQRNADILVLAEGFSAAYRLAAGKAFSTKIVDYLHSGRPILAVGPKEMNSIAYIERHGCGLAAASVSEAAEALRRLVDEPDLPARLTVRAWETGRTFHDTTKSRAVLSVQLALLAAGIPAETPTRRTSECMISAGEERKKSPF